MKWLILEETGEIAAILSANPGSAEPRRVVRRNVPADYPERIDWDAGAEAFVPSTAKALNALRAERVERLAACDWTQLPDVPEPTRMAWQTYRQELRDLPASTDPFNPAWPSPPVAEPDTDR